MNIRFVVYLILVTRKLVTEVLFNDFIDKEWRICIFNKIGPNFLCVIMKGVRTITNFKRPIYQTFSVCVWSVIFCLLIPKMNTSRKAMEWLICFSIVNLILGCLWLETRFIAISMVSLSGILVKRLITS